MSRLGRSVTFDRNHRSRCAGTTGHVRPEIAVTILRMHSHVRPESAVTLIRNTHLGQLKVMSAIEQCRSAALGGHVLRCAGCAQIEIAYNSCRNRHCPKCQAQRRTALARGASGRSAAGGVLPRGLHAAGADQRDIAYYNKAVIYGLLFDVAAETLRTIAADPQASRRADRRHPGAAHLGLGADASSARAWHRPRRRAVARRRALGRLPARLLPAGARALAAVPAALPRRTRGGCIAAASCGSSASTPRWPIAHAFASGSRRCAQCEWVVYAKRPFAGPEAVLAYLSRYTHRVAISNQRLIALDERGVTFRWKDYRAKGRTRYKTMTLSADEFMRRFLLHVLPAASTASATTGCSPTQCGGTISRRYASCCTSTPRRYRAR